MSDNLYRVYKNICTLLYKRGHNKIEVPENFNLRPTINSTPRPGIESEPINVYFPDEDNSKVGINSFKTYIKEMKESNIKRAILVTKNGTTPFVEREIERLLSEESITIEIFTEKSLLIDITEHILVPKYEILTTTEKDKLLESLSIKDKQLSIQLITDPISKYYGLKKGDIVKIIRPSETGGIYHNYKIIN